MLLLAALAIGALWLQHHLGFEFEKLGWVTLFGLIWGGMERLAGWIGAKPAIEEEASRLKGPLIWLVNWLARPLPLKLTGGLLALLIALVSSVSVRSETAGERSAVSLTALEHRGDTRRKMLSSDAPVARFLLITSPFGRPYQLDAEGYVPAQITVYPVTGREVLLGRDLGPSPTVLFRPFAEGMAALSDGARFTVTRLRGDSSQQLAVDSSGSGKAFRLGRPRPITDAMVMSWSLEATASGAPEPVRAQMLLGWRTPKALAMPGELAPRDCLLAEVRLHNRLKARGLVTLTDAPLVDLLLQDVTDSVADSAAVTSC